MRARKFSERLPALLIVLSILGVYGGVVCYEFLAWDDTTHVTENPHLQDPWHFWTHLYQGFYAPITFTLWSLLYKTFGARPLVFHGANLILHILNALLVFLFLKEVFRELLRRERKESHAGGREALAAAAGALLFALHPVQV